MFYLIQRAEKIGEHKLTERFYLVAEEIIEDNSFWRVIYFRLPSIRWHKCAYTPQVIWLKNSCNKIIKSYNKIEDFIGEHFEDFL